VFSGFLRRLGLTASSLGISLTLLLQACGGGNTESPAPQPAVAPLIQVFNIGAVTGLINQGQHLISVYVPVSQDITALVPTIVVPEGVTVSPLSGVSQDFTHPVTYTATGADGATQAYVVTVSKASAPLSAADLNAKLGIGINLGNTLDATPNEGSWAAPAQEAYFDAYKAAGFSSVRIPITWNAHFGTTAPYTIDPAFLARVSTVANWGTSRGLAVVINAHHEAWLKADYTNQIGRFEALWSQISTAFKDWPSSLAFEILNEPQDKMTDANVNDLNARILAIIRRTNPTRVVIIGANSYNSMGSLMNADFTVPNDPYLIATFHYYNPWSFCGQSSGTWGSAANIATVASDFAALKSWGARHSIPLYMGEYGVTLQYQGVSTDSAGRLLWYQTVCQQAHTNSIASAAWDDSGDFGIFHRAQGTWEAPILNAILLK